MTLDANKGEIKPEQISANIRASTRPRVLVVDDMPICLTLAQKVLAQSYGVSLAKGGQEALSMLRGTYFDLLMLDIEMPGISGIDLFKTILQHPDCRYIPVIFVTSDKDTDVIKTVVSMGAKDYIVKPYQGATLLNKVYRALKLGASADQAMLFLRRRMKSVIEACEKGNVVGIQSAIDEFPLDLYSGFVTLKMKRMLFALHNNNIQQVMDIAQEIIKEM
ncbi:MAG: response regulator [Treponema sp.]|jgi:CheY-like chemotaxis protein|nr:response regulator [Treponema sp.]